MKGHIIQLHGDPHRDVLALLPWHVTGQLDAADTGRVESHLESCAACRAALVVERRLEREIVREPSSADAGWADMRLRLDLDHPQPEVSIPQRQPARQAPSAGKPWLRWPLGWRPGWGQGWWLGAPLGFVSLAILLMLPPQPLARFTALGTAAPPAAGNMLVIFRPDTSEAVFRETLRAQGARLVDGPTTANAYVVAVPAATRTITLERMRHHPQVVLAEPIDAGRQP